MKLIHLSDLHLGKRVNEFPMLADQRFILAQILQIIDGERPDGVLIAGDVYDKSVPPVEAVELFDDFLVKLAERKIPAFVIGGNHDSPERLAFCNRLIDASGIHISPAYTGAVQPLTLSDEYGKINLYMLPFVNGKTNAEYPEIAQALSVLSSAIDDATMQKLNYEVVEKGRDRAEVARTFLLERGLVKPEDFKN